MLIRGSVLTLILVSLVGAFIYGTERLNHYRYIGDQISKATNTISELQNKKNSIEEKVTNTVENYSQRLEDLSNVARSPLSKTTVPYISNDVPSIIYTSTTLISPHLKTTLDLEAISLLMPSSKEKRLLISVSDLFSASRIIKSEHMEFQVENRRELQSYGLGIKEGNTVLLSFNDTNVSAQQINLKLKLIVNKPYKGQYEGELRYQEI